MHCETFFEYLRFLPDEFEAEVLAIASLDLVLLLFGRADWALSD
jgi:hypothetical protein